MIRPKEGGKIIFNTWAMFGGPPPNKEFTGIVVKVHRHDNGHVDYYEVKRDYDGIVQNVYRHNLVGYISAKQQKAS